MLANKDERGSVGVCFIVGDGGINFVITFA